MLRYDPVFPSHLRNVKPRKALAAPLSLVLLAMSLAGAAEQVYVSDDLFTVLHAGPGRDYRWVARLEVGTALTASERSDDGEWTKVTTTRGTEGWVDSDYLTTETPAALLLPAAETRAERLETQRSELQAALAAAREETAAIGAEQARTDAELRRTADELATIKEVSGRALTLDSENKRLVEEVEVLRGRVDTLEEDNQRLQDRLQYSQIIDGAIAVGIGVVITLIVPRLWPQRRRRRSRW